MCWLVFVWKSSTANKLPGLLDITCLVAMATASSCLVSLSTSYMLRLLADMFKVDAL